MMKAIATSLTLGLFLLACGTETADRERACGNVDIDLDVVAGLDADGGAVVRGTIRAIALIGDDAAGGSLPAAEGTVQDVYVGGMRVTRSDFNFRGFSATLSREVVCNYVSGEQASLPVRVVLFGEDGLCTYEPGSPLTLEVPADHCANGEGGATSAQGGASGGGGAQGGGGASGGGGNGGEGGG